LISSVFAVFFCIFWYVFVCFGIFRYEFVLNLQMIQASPQKSNPLHKEQFLPLQKNADHASAN